MNVQKEVIIVLTCNTMHYNILIENKILTKISNTQLPIFTRTRDFIQRDIDIDTGSYKYRIGNKYNCIVEITNDEKKIFNINPYFTFMDKTNILVDYKFIFIVGDEDYGYQEMIKAMFYLGLGHQVILIIDKIYKPSSFFGYEELNEIRKYPLKYLRSKKDYFGDIKHFIRKINGSGVEQLFKTRKNKFDNIQGMFNKNNLGVRYIEQLKYKYLSYPTFTQKRIDFDAPYCTIDDIENSFLPIDRICRFTLKPLLKFSFYFAHICRLSIILTKQRKDITSKMIISPIEINNTTNIDYQVDVQDNETITEKEVKKSNQINIRRNEILQDKIEDKLKEYFDYLEKIEYVDSYDIIRAEDISEITYGFNFFMMLRFNIDQLEDFDLVKLNFLQYFISRKFNLTFPKVELEYVISYPNSLEVNYELDIERDVSKTIKEIFEKNPSMKNRLLRLYLDIESQKEYMIYSRYQINKRLHNLYRYILTDDYKTKYLIVSQTDIEPEPRKPYTLFVDKKEPKYTHIILDLTKSSDIIDKYLYQKKKENEDLKQKLEQNPNLKQKYMKAKRIQEFRYYFPNLSEQEYQQLYKDEIEEFKRIKDKKTILFNKINQEILKRKIPLIPLTNYFIVNINNNIYEFYVSNVPDQSELSGFLNKLTSTVQFDCPAGILPQFEQSMNTVIQRDASGRQFYEKKIYYVKDKPIDENIVQIPFDMNSFNQPNFVPRVLRTEQLTSLRREFMSNLKNELYQMNGYFNVSEYPNEQFYIVIDKSYINSSKNLTKLKILYEFDESDYKSLLTLYRENPEKNYLKLFTPNKVYITNIQPNRSLHYLYIPIQSSQVQSIFNIYIRKYLQLQPTMRIKYIQQETEQSVVQGGVGSGSTVGSTISSTSLTALSGLSYKTIHTLRKLSISNDPNVIKLENVEEVSLTIIQGFYQFISLTYLMDFYNNINNGRRFLKSLRDTLYRDNNWKQLYLPEININES